MTNFTNDHLSYSRLSRFENCPLAFKFHYIDKLRPNKPIGLRFGALIHEVLEELVLDAIERKQVGPLSEDRALHFLDESWPGIGRTEPSTLLEGVELIRRFVRRQGDFDYRNILAVEKEFHLQVDRFTVLGYIDRVDRVDHETIRIIDYKARKNLLTPWYLEHDQQLSIYTLAAQQIWPWAKRVKLAFWMLRHDQWQETERTPEQLAETRERIESVGRQTEEATEFPPRPNRGCAWCDHQHRCPAVVTPDCDSLAQGPLSRPDSMEERNSSAATASAARG